MADCRRCSLRQQCLQVVLPKGHQAAPLMVVGEHPTRADEIEGEPFSPTNREGLILKKLLGEAGLMEEAIYWTCLVKCTPNKLSLVSEHVQACKGWLWEELKTVGPKIILSLGSAPTCLLLRKPKSFHFSGAVGALHAVPYMGSLIAPWYSARYLLHSGKKIHERTVDWFKKIRERIEWDC